MIDKDKKRINLVSSGPAGRSAARAGVDPPLETPDLSPAAIDILKCPPKMMLSIGLVLLLAPLVLWLALVVPRVQEITGAAAASGHTSKDGLLIGIMLAVISVTVSLLASIIRAYAHSETQERIELERDGVEQLREPMDAAQRAEAEAVEALNVAIGATDAIPTTYGEHQNAIVDHFWEAFFARHANDPSVYGTWSDKAAVKERFATKFEVLFAAPQTLTPKDIEKLIKDNRDKRHAAAAYTTD
jgi:hypothetical protein